MSPFILLPNCLFTSSFLLRTHLLAFLFSSLYNSKHLSFETSSFAFSTINHAFFFTFNRLHHLFFPPLTVRILTSYFSTPTYFFCTANNCFQIYFVSACSHSTDLLASVLTYLSLLPVSYTHLTLPTSDLV